MSVEFIDNAQETYQSRKVIGDLAVPPTSNLLIKIGVVKDSKHAYYFLFIASILFFGVTIFVAIKANHQSYRGTPADYNVKTGLTEAQKKQLSPEALKNFTVMQK